MAWHISNLWQDSFPRWRRYAWLCREEINKLIGSLQDALSSRNTLEEVVAQAHAKPPENIFTGLINFFGTVWCGTEG